MSKRIILSDTELDILSKALRHVLNDGGDYADSGKIGKAIVRRLCDRLGVLPVASPDAKDSKESVQSSGESNAPTES